MRDISEIIKDGGAALERLLREAFDAGVEHGREGLRAQLARLLNTTPPQPSFLGSATNEYDREPPGNPINVTPETVARAAQHVMKRALPGTVKPTILKMIDDDHLFGISTEQLIERTGFKPNSVRGTVSTLQAEGLIEKFGTQWHSVKKAPDADGAEMNKGATGE